MFKKPKMPKPKEAKFPDPDAAARRQRQRDEEEERKRRAMLASNILFGEQEEATNPNVVASVVKKKALLGE